MDFSDVFFTEDHLIDLEQFFNLSHREQTRATLGRELCDFMDEIGRTGKEIQSRDSEYYKTEQAYNQLIKKKEILKGLAFSLTDDALEERLACLKFLLVFSKELPNIYLKILGENVPDEQKKFFSELIENDKENLTTLLLTEIIKEYLYLITASREVVKAVEHMSTIIAKQNRAKQDRTDKNKQKAIDEAIRIWGNSPNYSLDEVAERIKKAEITDKSHSTIKQWISKYNPTRRKKK